MANAGVVGMAEVVTPNSSVTGNGKMSIASNVTWSFIWVGAAALFLVMIHMALVGRAGR